MSKSHSKPDKSDEPHNTEIEKERLEIEKTKLDLETRFWNKNAGTVITATVSLVAIIVSLAQVWVAKISRDTELQVTTLQKRLEIEVLDKQKEKELAILNEQRNREWSLNAAKFVTENRRAIFDGTIREQYLYAKLIPTIFPKEVADSLLDKLISVSPPSRKKTWRQAQSNSLANGGIREEEFTAERKGRIVPDPTAYGGVRLIERPASSSASPSPSPARRVKVDPTAPDGVRLEPNSTPSPSPSPSPS
jgi:hypothetical protein